MVKRTEVYTVDKKKFTAATKKVTKLLRDEFGEDYSGDPNVEFVLIDRERFERMHFIPIPYSHKDAKGKSVGVDDAKLEEAFDAAMFNLVIAHDHVQSLYRMHGIRKREIERKAARGLAALPE